MPKRSAFYIFMMERKSKMIAEGQKLLRGPSEVAAMIGEEWNEISEEEKAKYKQLADDHNAEEAKEQQLKAIEAAQSPPKPLFSTPEFKIPQDEFPKIAIQLAEKYRGMESRIHEFRAKTQQALSSNNDLTKVPIILLQFNTYSEDVKNYLLGEVAITVFNLADGILENYAALIDPVDFKAKSKGVVEKAAKELALPMPGYDLGAQNYGEILELIFIIGYQYAYAYRETVTFQVLQKDMLKTDLCLNWLIQKSGQTGHRGSFQILPLEIMICKLTTDREVFILLKSVKDDLINFDDLPEAVSDVVREQVTLEFGLAKEEMKRQTQNLVAYPSHLPFVQHGGFFHLSHVENFLKMDNYANYEELACIYHQERRDGVYNCPLGRTNRCAFSIIAAFYESYRIVPQPGFHYPTLADRTMEKQRRRDLLEKWQIIDSGAIGKKEAESDMELLGLPQIYSRRPFDRPLLPSRSGHSRSRHQEMGKHNNMGRRSSDGGDY